MVRPVQGCYNVICGPKGLPILFDNIVGISYTKGILSILGRWDLNIGSLLPYNRFSAAALGVRMQKAPFELQLERPLERGPLKRIYGHRRALLSCLKFKRDMRPHEGLC